MPNDKKKIDAHQRNFKNLGLKALDIHCYLCKELGHVSANCNLYVCNKKRIIGPKYSRQIKLNTKLKREEQPIYQDDVLWKRFNLQSTSGKEAEAKELYKDNPYLENLADKYLGLVDMTFRRNSEFLVMIDEQDKVEDKSSSAKESDCSRENYFAFKLPKIGARLSFESQVFSFQSD